MALALGCGDSLKPLVKASSLVEMEDGATRLSPGDLAVYCQNRIQICHLVMFAKEDSGMRWYFFKGSSVFQVDGWIPEYRVLGRVISVDGIGVNSLEFRLKIYRFYLGALLRYGLYCTLFTSSLGVVFGKIRSSLGIRAPISTKIF